MAAREPIKMMLLNDLQFYLSRVMALSVAVSQIVGPKNWNDNLMYCVSWKCKLHDRRIAVNVHIQIY